MLASNDRQRGYIARGQRFRSATVAELRRLFVAGYDSWLATFPHRDGSVDDVQAELELRGEAPPFETVSMQIEELASRTTAFVEAAQKAKEASAFIPAPI